MTCTVLVLVRTESERLKKKALLEINQKPLIKILLDRIKNDNRNLIVCTTDKPSDDELAKYITDNNFVEMNITYYLEFIPVQKCLILNLQ